MQGPGKRSTWGLLGVQPGGCWAAVTLNIVRLRGPRPAAPQTPAGSWTQSP